MLLFYSMSDNSKKSLIYYLESISDFKCTCIMTYRSAEMQYYCNHQLYSITHVVSTSNILTY